MKKIRGRLIFVSILALVALWTAVPTLIYFSMPPDQRNDPAIYMQHVPKFFPKGHINLGLDLQGGVQLVLGVDTVGAVDNKLDRMSADLTKWAEEKKIALKTAFVIKGKGRLRIELNDGVDVNNFKDQFKKDFAGLVTAKTEGQNLEYQFDDQRLIDIKASAIEQAERVIRSRVDKWGVAEPVINRRANNSVMVQLPGFKDPAKAKELLGRTAQLKFKIVDDEFGGFADLVSKLPSDVRVERSGSGVTFVSENKAAIIELTKGKVPPDRELLFEMETIAGGSKSTYKSYVVIAATEMSGEDVLDAMAVQDNSSFDTKPGVSLKFTQSGGRRFEEITGKNVRKRMAIILDDTVVSAPVINQKIAGGNAMITLGGGDYQKSMDEATQLSLILKSGALPATITILEERQVGATLGPELARQGILSAVLGLALVFVFMIVYYNRPGLLASIALLLNALFLISLMALFNFSLSLPGIAGFILTLGMAVDANVLINERIRLELRDGKSGRKALDLGFGKAFWTIFDGHVTTLLASVVLLETTTSGPIRGFAITLLIGLSVSMFTSLYCARLMFDIAVFYAKTEAGIRKWVGAGLHGFLADKDTKIDFIGASPKFLVLCGLAIAAMIGVSVTKGLNWSVDFAGGTEVEVSFQQDVQSSQIEEVAKKSEIEEISIQALGGGSRQFLVRFDNKKARESIDGTMSSDPRAQIFQQHLKSDLSNAKPEVLRVDYVGPQVGKELRNQGVLSLLYALLGIVVYVALRFDVRFGPGSFIKLFVDLSAVAGFYIFFQRSFDLTSIAALLTIAGYGINDAVVVYDRIREIFHEKPNLPVAKAVNLAINQTLSRTTITSFATMLSLIGIMAFGTGSIWNFAASMVVGIIVATLSSMLIAAYGVVRFQHLTQKNS